MRLSVSLASPKLPAGISTVWIRQLVRFSLEEAVPSVAQQAEKRVKLELAFVSDAKIQALNREFRGKDRPTDVLSFSDFTSPTMVARSLEPVLDLGTVVVSLPFVRRSAKEDGVSWKRELAYVLSHGVLHLIGFDHEPRMFAIQDQVTDALAPVPKQK